LVFIVWYSFSLLRDKSHIDFRFIKTPVFLFLFLFVIFSCLSIFKAVNLSEAVVCFLKNGVFFVFFAFTTLVLVNNKVPLSAITKIVVVFSSLIIAIGLFQTLNVMVHEALTDASTKVVKAVFMNKNLYSQMLYLTLPFNLYGIFAFRKKWKTWSTVNSLLSLVVITLLITRSVWLALIVSSFATMAFVGIYNIKRDNKLVVFGGKRVKALLLAGSTITITLLIIAASGGFTDPKGMMNKKMTSSEARLVMWQKSLAMFADHPFFGVGGGNWKVQIPNYGVYNDIKIRNKKRFQRPHNDYLWILTENGTLGFLAFLSVFIISLFYLFRIIDESQNKEDRMFYLLMFSGLVGYMVFSFFSYPGERAETSIYLFFLLSLVTAKYHQLRVGAEKSTSAKVWLFMASPLVLVLLAASYVGIIRIKAEGHTRLAINALHTNRFETTIREIDKGYTWFYGMDPTATPLLWYKGLANFRKGNTDKALKNFLGASVINPFHSHTYNSIGILYATKGRFVKAKENFLKSLELRPYSSETLINLAKIYIQDEQFEKAFEELKKIDPKSKNKSFKINMVRVLEYKVDRLADSIQEATLHDYLLSLKASKPNTLAVYQSSVKEERSFESQFLRAAARSLIGSDSTLSQSQRKLLNTYLNVD
ncbi:MAG: O-antigen ligase family protein, partial [Bacteroidales bacterium]|nr:O-antigen ligase family protein [Bacteroidales bacterium]